MKVFIFILTSLVFSGSATFAGQSLQSATQSVTSSTFPDRANTLPWRVEFYLHDWADTPTATSRVAQAGAIGLDVYFNTPNLLIYNTRESGISNQCQIPLSNVPTKAMYVRYQHNPDTLTDYCEAWDLNGTLVHTETITYTSKSGTATGFTALGTTGESRSLGFIRVHSTLVGLNARVPVTADNTNTLLHWKFDNALTDASGGGYTGTISSGSPTYVTTPNQIASAIIKTSDAPSWTNWISMRAGYPNTLDGNSSFTQGDTSTTVTCNWHQVSGPSTVEWSDRTACAPVIEGLVFGEYDFQLQVTDAGGLVDTSTQKIGSVAYDSKGIVIHSDPNVETIFGPMIAYGQSPWGYMDERNLQMVTGQQTYFDANWPASQPWMSNGAGTVAYEMRPANKTTLNGAITATATSITVTSAAALDLSSFPTMILIGCYNCGVSNPRQPDEGYEYVEICSAAGNVLTVCFDGRGKPAQTIGGYNAGAVAWSTAINVAQPQLTGTGTTFLTDSKALCPAGAGPGGVVAYSTGTVTLTAGSTTVTGSGTAWTSSHVGKYIRVAATHSSGTAFVFSAAVTAFTSATQITVSRAAPTGVDATAFSYKLLSRIWATPSYGAPDNSSQLIYHDAVACVSETKAFTHPYLEMANITTNAQSGRTYTYMDTQGMAQHPTAGVNYYGSGPACRAFYYRSGMSQALDLANRMDNWWIRHPEVSGGWTGTSYPGPGRMGGVVGAIANIVLNDSALIDWTNIRGQIDWALTNSQSSSSTCDGSDTRDAASAEMQVILAALFEADPAVDSQSRRTTARTALSAAGGVNAKDNLCRTQGRTALAAETNSWATGFYFSGHSTTTPLTATNGATTMSGTSIPSSICHGIASGTATATNGSATLTGSGFVNGDKIVITGTSAGSPWVRFVMFTQTGGTSATLSAQWDGDSGTVNWIIEDDSSADTVLTIASGTGDNQAAKNWSCTWNSSTQITLNRAWDGPSGTVYTKWGNLSGYAQQAFMLSMKTYAMNLGAVAETQLGLATDFATNANLAANWVKTYGVDPATKGVYYGRIMSACEPPATAGDASFSVTLGTGNCSANALNSSSVQTDRVQLGELNNAFRVLYENSATTANKDWVDAEFAALWGKSSMTDAGFPTDANYVQFELSDSSLAGTKWPGFFFGMGMSHQWPAARMGSVDPQINRILNINASRAAVPNAAKIKLDLTYPSGVIVTSICSADTCTITADARQRLHLLTIAYLNAGDVVLASSSEALITDVN